MYTIRQLYKIGNGPSSSHTMGPKLATEKFLEKYQDLDSVTVYLYGSLALTGKGHLTDTIVDQVLQGIEHKIVFDINEKIPHPNTMKFEGYKLNQKVAEMVVYSIGGGAIKIEGEKMEAFPHIYPLDTFKNISEYCKSKNMRLYEYVDSIEDDNFSSYMEDIYKVMEDSIDRGLNTEGLLPGKLNIKRKAGFLYKEERKDELAFDEKIRHLIAYAYAVAEENASGGLIVTSPTCGACGVLPAVMRYEEELNKYSHQQIINALKTAGLIGNIVKFRGSISGAEAGCQAEIGTACMMASSFVSELNNMSIDEIGRSAEIALEHFLGLTCDPVLGYVQIPCIERNAVASLRAINASRLASYLISQDAKISLDTVIETMKETGEALPFEYRETSVGGLAKKYKD